MKPEKAIQNEIMNFLRTIGVFCWQNDSVGIYDPVKKTYRRNNNVNRIRGVSDILGIVQGRFLAIEVKSGKGRLTDEQRVFLAKINNEGGIAFVARSIEQAVEQLLSHFPENQRLRQFAKEYLQSRGMGH